jgi:TldD protein
MNIIEPGIRNLATAKDVLLTPYGLDEALLSRTLAEIFTHRIDYADLYFQATRSEAWSLEEGIVKSGSFSIDQGVGVRAVSGDRTAFAYSDDLSPEAIRQAALATRSIAKAGGGKQKIKVASSLTCICRPIRCIRSTRPPRSNCSSASNRWRAAAIRVSPR